MALPPFRLGEFIADATLPALDYQTFFAALVNPDHPDHKQALIIFAEQKDLVNLVLSPHGVCYSLALKQFVPYVDFPARMMQEALAFQDKYREQLLGAKSRPAADRLQAAIGAKAAARGNHK